MNVMEWSGWWSGCVYVYVLGIRIVDVAPKGIHDAEHVRTETYVVIGVAPEEAALVLLRAGPQALLLRQPRETAVRERLLVLVLGRRLCVEGEERGVVREQDAVAVVLREVDFAGEGVAFAGAGALAAPVFAEVGDWWGEDHVCADVGNDVCFLWKS